MLKDRMRKAVEQRYPETEGNTPVGERQGTIPPSIAELLKEE